MSSTDSEWECTAAYLYILHLDNDSIAWEYLRRNLDYRNRWMRSEPFQSDEAASWGLRFRRRP